MVYTELEKTHLYPRCDAGGNFNKTLLSIIFCVYEKRYETVDIEYVLLLCDLECVLFPRPSWLDECEHSAQLSTGTFCCNIYLHSAVL